MKLHISNRMHTSINGCKLGCKLLKKKRGAIYMEEIVHFGLYFGCQKSDFPENSYGTLYTHAHGCDWSIRKAALHGEPSISLPVS
jgi:hypothetical protein